MKSNPLLRLLFAVLSAALVLGAVSPAIADDSASTSSEVTLDAAPDRSLASAERDDELGAPLVQSGADVVARAAVKCSSDPAKRVRYAVGRLLGDHWRGTRDICIPGKNGKPDRWRRGFCIDRGLPEATVLGLFTKKGKLDGLSLDDSRRVFDMANRYSQTRSADTAMHASQAIYLVIEPVAAKAQLRSDIAAGYITEADFRAAMAIYKASEKHGPYTVNLNRKAGQKVVVGTVRGVHGGLAPAGGKVTVSVTKGSAKVLKVNGKNGRRGTVRKDGTFYFKFSSKTKATFSVTVTYPSSGVIFMNKRSSTNSQRVLVGGHRESTKASITINVTVKHSASSSDECAPSCDGSSVNTMKVCRTNTSGNVKYARRGADGTFVGSVLVLKDGTKCGKVEDVLYDATKFTTWVCKNAGKPNLKCSSGWVKVPRSFHEVICPAWPKVELTVGCQCGDAWAYARFFAETNLPDGSPNKRGYKGHVKVTDEDVVIENLKDIEITKGSWNVVPITTAVAPGMVLEASFTSYYADGSSRQIVPRTVRVRVMVLSTTSAGAVTYRTVEKTDGIVTDRRTETDQVAPKFVDAERVGELQNAA